MEVHEQEKKNNKKNSEDFRVILQFFEKKNSIVNINNLIIYNIILKYT